MTYTYPNDVYDVPSNLLATLGSWWADQYAANDQMTGLVSAVCEVEHQSSQDLLELLDSMSRYTVPIYHTDNWYELRLSRAAQENVSPVNVHTYDSDITYDSGIAYDTKSDKLNYSHAKPAGMTVAPLITNKFTTPDLLWSPQLDYVVTDAAIVFFTDPFTDTRILKYPVYKDGILVDYYAILWIYRGRWDWSTIYQQFGYLLKLRMPSSVGYRDVLNATYDALLTGGAGTSVLQMLSAMTGIPLTKYPGEVVTELLDDSGGQLVITDHAAYRLPFAAPINVAVGDILPKNASLTTAVQIYELNRRPVIPDLTAISLGSGYLASCMYGDLLFTNKDVPLEVITDDPSGFTKLQWYLGGFPMDVDQFFDDLHDRGVAEATSDIDACADTNLIEHTGEPLESGEMGPSTFYKRATLAHLMDTRENGVNEPTAAALPTTINPCQFLIDNVLNKHATIIILRTAGFSTTGIGLQSLRLLKRILPPQSALLIMLEVEVATETVVASDNFSETLATWVGGEILSDVITVPYVADRGLTARIVYGA